MENVTTRHSQTLGKLAKALASAQGKIKDAKKDRQNPHFKNHYATLSSVREAITPALSEANIAVTQLNEPHGDAGVCVVTMLIHESGEWLASTLFVPVAKKDAQGFGSALSYARRYALASIVGIASDDDDDATQAVRGPTPAPPGEKVDVTTLVKLIENAANADDLAKATAAVSAVKDRLSEADRAAVRTAHEKTVRALGQKAAS